MIGALRLLQELGVATATNLLLHMVTDEEVAGPYTDSCLERGWPDAVIIGAGANLLRNRQAKLAITWIGVAQRRECGHHAGDDRIRDCLAFGVTD